MSLGKISQGERNFAAVAEIFTREFINLPSSGRFQRAPINADGGAKKLAMKLRAIPQQSGAIISKSREIV